MAQPPAAKSLGCYLYVTGDMQNEMGRRVGGAAWAWQKLGVFWKSEACSPKWKLMFYGTVIRAKLAYGLCIAALTRGQVARVDAFRMRGIGLAAANGTDALGVSKSSAVAFIGAPPMLAFRTTRCGG